MIIMILLQAGIRWVAAQIVLFTKLFTCSAKFAMQQITSHVYVHLCACNNCKYQWMGNKTAISLHSFIHSFTYFSIQKQIWCVCGCLICVHVVFRVCMRARAMRMTVEQMREFINCERWSLILTENFKMIQIYFTLFEIWWFFSLVSHSLAGA